MTPLRPQADAQLLGPPEHLPPCRYKSGVAGFVAQPTVVYTTALVVARAGLVWSVACPGAVATAISSCSGMSRGTNLGAVIIVLPIYPVAFLAAADPTLEGLTAPFDGSVQCRPLSHLWLCLRSKTENGVMLEHTNPPGLPDFQGYVTIAIRRRCCQLRFGFMKSLYGRDGPPSGRSRLNGYADQRRLWDFASL